MRLTLRTMLAYLDDILEPEDTEDIGKKIEESEFATNLVHRTRDCMRRLRLGVLPVVGKGLAADPNTVAEYLDNTLSGDRVPEFEKVCLESDVHLAEVASCHQILTLVLGEPAEIEPDARQRMYQLAAQADAPPVQSDAPRPQPVVSPPPVTAAPRRAKPEVPEYLRESSSRIWPTAAVVLIAALATLGGLFFFGPAQWRQDVTALVQGTTDDAVAPAAADESAAGFNNRPVAGQPVEPAAVADADTPAAPEPDDVAAAAVPEPDRPEPQPTEVPAATVPLPEVANTETSPLPAVAPVEDAGEKPERVDANEPFGRYTSKREVLLKYDPAAGDWKRLPAMSPLAKGDRLLALPCFRPMITLSTNISIQTDGAALLELVGWTEEGVPIVAIEYGRLWMLTVNKPGNSIELKLGDRQPRLTFVDTDSNVAISVEHVLGAGKDPAAGAPLLVDVYATSGLVRVREHETPLDMQSPAQRALFQPAAAQPSGDFPAWVSAEALSDFDRQAIARIEPQLLNERSVGLILREQTAVKQREVRSLAIRSCCYLNDFDPAIEALNEKDERNSWPAYIEELRAAVARSPEAAEAVRASLNKLRGGEGDLMFRMLRGYSAEDLKTGADSVLVDGLSHDSLDVRVLSSWTLHSIAGPSGYRPGDIAAKRKTSVASWKDKLKKGKIVPKTPAPPTRPVRGTAIE